MDAGKKISEVLKSVGDVNNACETCIKHKKRRPRSFVAMSMAKSFNETVVMDLKVWRKGLYFLVLFDTATRFCRAVVIQDKMPDIIAKDFFYTGYRFFEPPKKFLSDNGGVFSKQTMRDLSDGFCVHLVCTAAHSS